MSATPKPHNRRFKLIGWLMGFSMAGLLVAELGLRFAGVVDFPVYDTDEIIGYIPAPKQSGVFLNRNHWQVNERSMGSGPWQPLKERDILLLGDSVVWGGNPLDQADKLGPNLQTMVGSDWRVWSAAAGSWSVLNLLAYLDRYPDVEQEADLVVWVLNAGDLSTERSVWAKDSTHPRSKPTSALAYATQKYLLPRLASQQASPVSEAEPVELISAATTQLLKIRLAQLSSAQLSSAQLSSAQLSSASKAYADGFIS